MSITMLKCYRGSTEDIGRVVSRRDGRARLAGDGPVPVAAELRGERGRAGWSGHAAPRQATARRQVPAPTLPRLRRLPQRRGESPRLRREPWRLLTHRETFRNELLGLTGDHHQNKRRLNRCPCSVSLNSDLIFFPHHLRSDSVTVNITEWNQSRYR